MTIYTCEKHNWRSPDVFEVYDYNDARYRWYKGEGGVAIPISMPIVCPDCEKEKKLEPFIRQIVREELDEREKVKEYPSGKEQEDE